MLQQYDSTRLCPKCDFSADVKHDTEYGRNRMTRTCRRCFFQWTELPLDYDSAKEAQAMKDYIEKGLENMQFIAKTFSGK